MSRSTEREAHEADRSRRAEAGAENDDARAAPDGQDGEPDAHDGQPDGEDGETEGEDEASEDAIAGAGHPGGAAAEPAPTKPIGLRRRVRRSLRSIARRLVAWFGPAFLSRLARTWQVETIGAEHLEGARGQGGGHFIALWHGRMLLGLAHHGEQEWTVLVSGSQDGDISHALLDGFRYRVIRGSTSRGGARALRAMLAALETGAVVVITPDGPRGPRHSMNPGLAWMARATGYAIVPCGFACDRAWRARSWDRFTIPKPRARVAIVYDAPVRVERSAGLEELDLATERIRAGLIRAERRAFEHVGSEPDW